MSHRDRLPRHGPHRLRRAMTAGMAAAACSLPLAAVAAPGAAARTGSAPGAVAQTGRVSPTPATGTPQLANTGTTQTVRQLVQCGNTMYAVGSFTEIQRSATLYPRNNVFSFNAAAPFTVTPWNPDVSGEVNSIAFNGGNCADAYIGGRFTSVHGTHARDLAEVDTTTGAVVRGFAPQVGGAIQGGAVETLLAVNGHLLAGGYFTSIDGSTPDAYMASLNPATGADDGFLHLKISGHYVFHNVKNNVTEIYNQQLSHSGRLDLVEGDFTSVGGLPRQQIFMLNVGGTAAKVTGWSSPEFDGSKGGPPNGYYYQCGDSHPFYIHAAAWSPDDSEIYIADTGFQAWNWDGSYPLVGLCDAAAAFPATQKEVTHDWLTYDGCDSLYSAAAGASAVYVAGHNRWFPNPDACNRRGPGAIPAPGLAGLTPGPTGGSLITNAAGTAGLYSRSRGHGADDMLLTSAGLWIASDNFGGGISCGGKAGYAGICFLPYS